MTLSCPGRRAKSQWDCGTVCVCVCVCVCTCLCLVCVVCFTSSDTLLSMAPNMECNAPTEKPHTGSLTLAGVDFYIQKIKTDNKNNFTVVSF